VSNHVWAGPTYPQVLAEALTRYPGREAFVDGDRRITYAETASLISRMQQLLYTEDVKDGAIIMTLSPNVPEVFCVHAAAAFNNASFSGLHPMGSVDDHAKLCEDTAATVLVAHPSYADAAAAIAERAASITTVLTLGPADIGRDLLAEITTVTPRPLRAPSAPSSATVWLPYTGGTTGQPKGVQHSHRSLVQGSLCIAASWGLPQTPRYLACAPITHASQLPILPTLARGGTVILNRGFDADRWLDTVAREHVNYAFSVPTMLYGLLDVMRGRRDQIGSLETITYGSSPMSPTRIEEALDTFGRILVQGFGQTESLGLATVLDKADHDPVRFPHRLRSCGRAAAGAQVDILDDSGEPVAASSVGELCIRGGFVMDGYWKRPAETAEALRGDWLHTGDLASRDEDGYIRIVDRKRDMIISGAFNIFPREIEEVLAVEPTVSAAAVIGVPDAKWGEAVTAFVVPRPGHTIDTEALQTLVRQRKGRHQVPKQVFVMDSLPLTAVGKIDKKQLRSQFWNDTDRAVN